MRTACSNPVAHRIVAATFCFIAFAASACSEDRILVGQGQTMGSTYSVKVFDPPTAFPSDWHLAVDKELRLVTDQMSTYIKSSEISRFNESPSTDWFPVSDDLALVVARSIEISELSDGAFDITVLPIVKAWSFGPGKKRLVPPPDSELEALRESVGYQNVEARLHPPALRKKLASITLDLNAIAPGHGVDRLVELLLGFGAKNLFVEIGGEVRVTGDKAGKPWTVGIQQPDVDAEVVAIAYPVCDKSIATSGDYRSFFEYEGRRYSHTIDPRTGRPVTHNLASVTVLANDCMSADALATTMSVLGEDEGIDFANRLGLDTLVMVRGESGEISMQSTGAFASVLAVESQSSNEKGKDEGNSTMDMNAFVPVATAGLVAFSLVVVAMAVGVIFGRRAISGSCGGLANSRDADGNTSCSLCSNPDNACKELRKRMQTSDSSPRL